MHQAPYKVTEEGLLNEAREHEVWVRATDDVHRIAGDIIDKLDDHGDVDVACIGAGCINQAVKAIAVVRGRLAKDGEDLCTRPFFSSFVDKQERKRSRMILRLHVVDLVDDDTTY